MIYPILHKSTPSLVPETAGVYMIQNTASGDVYIGMARNLRRRYDNWHRAMRRPKTITRHMRAAIAKAPREAWRFAVVADGAGLDDASLFALELAAIKSALAKGTTLMNVRPNCRARTLRVLAARGRPSLADPEPLYAGFDLPDTP